MGALEGSIFSVAICVTGTVGVIYLYLCLSVCTETGFQKLAGGVLGQRSWTVAIYSIPLFIEVMIFGVSKKSKTFSIYHY